MSATLTSILAGVALEVGAPIVVSILKDKFGDQTGGLAETVIDAVAKQAGVPADALPDLPITDLEAAVKEVEKIAPEMIALYAAGLRGQFALAEAENKDGGLAAAWRWGWMYLLGFFWTWAIIVVPTINAATGSNIAMLDVGILLTLTSWFIALYMGGHTVKELGKNVIDAVRSWKGQP